MKKPFLYLLILGLLVGSVLPSVKPVYASDYPQVAAITGGSDSSGTNHTVSLPPDIALGNLLIIFLKGEGGTPTISFPVGWTQLFDTQQGTSQRFVAYYRVADGGEGGSITVTTSGSEGITYTSLRITDYSGVPECGTSDSGLDDVPDPPSVSPTWGAMNSLWIACCSLDSYSGRHPTISSYPTNYTDGRQDTNSDTYQAVGTARRELNSASEDPGVFTLGNGNYWIANTIVVKPMLAHPAVTTSATDNISCETATLNGEITNIGGATVDYYAFVWDTSSHGAPGDVEPGSSGYSDNWTSALGDYEVDDYSHNIDGLNVDDTYYVRFAAHNSEGWSYGDEVDFDTLAIPTIITQSATDVTVSSARLQAYLDDDGGQACQVRFGWGEIDQSDNITAYDHYSVYAGSYTTGQSPYLDIDTLDAGTTYFFNVEAYGAGCATDTGTSDNFTTESSVGSPSNVIAIPDIDNVTLSWVKGTGAPNTFIRFKMNTCPADETDGTLIYMSTASTYTHESLVSGADYCYYLVGYDSVEGYSSGHVTIHATTLAAGLPADTEGEAIDKPVGGMTSSPAVSATLIEKIPILLFTQKDAAAIGMPHANFLYIIMLLGMMGLSYAVFRWTHEPMVIVAVWLIGVAWIARPILGIPLVVPIFITIVGAGYSVYRLRSVV